MPSLTAQNAEIEAFQEKKSVLDEAVAALQCAVEQLKSDRKKVPKHTTLEADLIPNMNDKTLTIRLHHLANRSSDEAVRHLCAELNATETIYPETELRLVYELVS